MPIRAGFWIRTLAAVIDAVAWIILTFVIAGLFFSWSPRWQPEVLDRVEPTTILLACLAYTFLEVVTRRTVGKLLFHLRIRRGDGEPADFWQLFLRWSTKQFPLICAIIYTACDLPVFYMLQGFSSLLLTIGCFFAANDDHLAWHDQWSGTAVFYQPVKVPLPSGFEVVQPSNPAGTDISVP